VLSSEGQRPRVPVGHLRAAARFEGHIFDVGHSVKPQKSGNALIIFPLGLLSKDQGQCNWQCQGHRASCSRRARASANAGTNGSARARGQCHGQCQRPVPVAGLGTSASVGGRDHARASAKAPWVSSVKTLCGHRSTTTIFYPFYQKYYYYYY
jgi:hypothetical protein